MIHSSLIKFVCKWFALFAAAGDATSGKGCVMEKLLCRTFWNWGVS